MPKPLVDLTEVHLLSVILAMVWIYHWHSIIDDKLDSAHMLGAIDSEDKLLIAQYEEKARLLRKVPELPDLAPEPPPTEPLRTGFFIFSCVICILTSFIFLLLVQLFFSLAVKLKLSQQQ